MQQSNFGYVYKTTDLTNGKVYLGQHRGKFDSGYQGSGLLISRAINKRGETNFTTKILIRANSKKQLDQMEKEFIKLYTVLSGKSKLYNIREGGNTYSLPLSVRRRISNKLKGRYAGELNPFYGKTHSEKTLKKMSEASKAKVGKLNGNWKGGVCLIKYYCACGRQICKGSKQCKSCVGKERNNKHFILMAKKRGAPWNKGLTKKTSPIVEKMATKKRKATYAN